MSVQVETITTNVVQEKRINGATGAEVSEAFAVEDKPQIAFNPEFSTNSDTAVVAVLLLDIDSQALRSQEYAVTNSGSNTGIIEAGWFKGPGFYIDTYGASQMQIEVVSLTGGALDIWRTKRSPRS